MERTPRQDVGKKEVEHTAGTVEREGAVIELVLDHQRCKTQFVRYAKGVWERVDEIVVDGVQCQGFPTTNDLLRHRVVRFPALPEEYGDMDRLRWEIQDTIHRYVTLADDFEVIVSAYVLLTWVYDRFNELPYLRVRGDYGTGKTRFLQVVGSLCYRPMFAGGASSVASVFHLLNDFRGTLILDEADFRFSDEKAEIAKILNNGNMEGFAVLRCELDRHRRFRPRAYNVYGPKIVATRGGYQDIALESRFLTADFDAIEPRKDTPVSLPECFEDEARRLRNRLLMYRFRNYHAVCLQSIATPGVSSRLRQIVGPLLSVSDELTQSTICRWARSQERGLASRRASSIEGEVLAALLTLRHQQDSVVSIKILQEEFLRRNSEEYDERITPRWIGRIVRERLGLRTYKSHGIYVIPRSENGKVDLLAARYGLQPTTGVDLGTSGTSQRE